jgi:hypothetical protein
VSITAGSSSVQISRCHFRPSLLAPGPDPDHTIAHPWRLHQHLLDVDNRQVVLGPADQRVPGIGERIPERVAGVLGIGQQQRRRDQARADVRLETQVIGGAIIVQPQRHRQPGGHVEHCFDRAARLGAFVRALQADLVKHRFQRGAVHRPDL